MFWLSEMKCHSVEMLWLVVSEPTILAQIVCVCFSKTINDIAFLVRLSDYCCCSSCCYFRFAEVDGFRCETIEK